MLTLALSLIAHGEGAAEGGKDVGALAAIAVAAMVIPLVVLGVVGRVFWRAAKRDQSQPPRPRGP